MSEASKPDSAWGWPVGAILALIPILFLTGRNAGKPEPRSAPVVAAAAATPASVPSSSPATEDTVPDYCVDRFLSPLQTFTVPGLPEASDPPVCPARAGRRVGTGWRVDLGCQENATPQWLRRVSDQARLNLEVLGAGAQIDTLIATVPDPVDSGFGYKFDTALQAIRLGIETTLSGKESRFRDASWLSWNDAGVADADRRKSEDCRQHLPSLVTFRGGATSRRVTALLLVGETATTGIHRAALLQALRVADAFRAATAAHNQKPLDKAPVKLLAPTFSGSVASLRASLREWGETIDPADPRQVSIITGSATGNGLRARLRSHRAEPPFWMPGADVEFWSTAVPEAELHCRYLWFVGRGHATGALHSVALLHESGTEFGGALTEGGTGCSYSAGVDVSFPAHISALREAYEQMDRDAPGPKGSMARRTNLDVSLREKRVPLGIDAYPSDKTTFARDVAVVRALDAISQSTVRHVVIQATDVADQIFLARKIRDVTPDVRIAFLGADVLLLHPAFRDMLRGSLVITPYPFLGASDFVSGDHGGSERPARRVDGFENSMAQGIHNATLALRGARKQDLREYVPPQGGSALPVWISTIGDAEFVPLAVTPNSVPDGRNAMLLNPVFPGVDDTAGSFHPDAKRLTEQQDIPRLDRWRQAVAPLHAKKLRLAPDVAMPRLWQFLTYAVILAFAIDRILQRRTRRGLSPEAFPKFFSTEDDGVVDRAIVRTKWLFYASIRTFALVVGFAYLTCFWCFGIYLRAAPPTGWEYVGELALGAGVLCGVGYLVRDIYRFLAEYLTFNKLASDFTLLGAGDADEMDLWDRMTVRLGLARADSNVPPARLSFAQLTVLLVLTFGVASGFLVAQWKAISQGIEVSSEYSAVARTLLVQRVLDLASGVSMAAPTLAFLATVYAWAVGRMARLAVVHGVSRLTPDDGIPDLVSTPIRLILHPLHKEGAPNDEAFTRVERQSINTIIRPITGPSYCAALAILLALPIAIFLLSPISSLEHSSDWMLLALHYVCSVLIGNTLVQLFQYWVALERLLKRVSQHALGRSFGRVAPFVRESIHEQVSRQPNDLLRLAACAVQFDDLVRWGKRLSSCLIAPSERADLEGRQLQLRKLRVEAISAGSSRKVEKASETLASLGLGVVGAAHVVMKLVSAVWAGQRLGRNSMMPPPPTPQNSSSKPQPVASTTLVPGRPQLPMPPNVANPERESPVADATVSLPAPPSIDHGHTAEAWRYGDDEREWLRDAEAFAATVVAVLINRHVRQLQYFVYTLLSCSLLFLLAALSYPFEPHRLLKTWAWVLVLVAIGAGLWTYLELDRNLLLSKIAKSDPGKATVDRGFVLRILAWGIAPLIAAAATEYPDLVNSLTQLFGTASGK